MRSYHRAVSCATGPCAIEPQNSYSSCRPNQLCDASQNQAEGLAFFLMSIKISPLTENRNKKERKKNEKEKKSKK
jgi:hypothetical protein